MSNQNLNILLEEVLKLQKSFQASKSPDMERRKQLVNNDLLESFRQICKTNPDLSSLEVDSSNGLGNNAVVPWVRIFSRRQSSSPQNGFYLVLLFSGDGSSVSLSLNLGVTKLTPAQIESEVAAARLRINSSNLSPYTGKGPQPQEKMNLSSGSNPLAKRYELGNVICFELTRGQIPDDEIIGQQLEWLAARLELQPNLSGAIENKRQLSPSITSINDELTTLQLATGWSLDRIERVLRSIYDASPQIIFGGPPGTGKTFVAREFAKFILEDGSSNNDIDERIEIVQFHPSYGYDEFVEGLRPVANEAGQLVFRSVPGVIVRMADQIEEDGLPRVLIVDEMNRANLPKVFGELMYLLEYRDQSVALMHRGSFRLPKNLYVLGTMNTADRSIKQLDMALRRRFDFFEILPDVDILKKHYANRVNALGPKLFKGFEELNGKIAEIMMDTNHGIGHSYFMRDEMNRGVLADIWELQLYPLLQDYFYDQPVTLREFTVDSFWPNI